MSEEFEDISSRIPDLATALTKRIIDRKAAGTPQTVPTKGFDPYQALLKRKEEETAPINPDTIRLWPVEDITELENYCKTHGVTGFNFGNMSPKIALMKLKREIGDYTGVPLEDRIPEGWEKAGTHSGNPPGHPYAPAQKELLLG